jgi:hypothetical protein
MTRFVHQRTSRQHHEDRRSAGDHDAVRKIPIGSLIAARIDGVKRLGHPRHHRHAEL